MKSIMKPARLVEEKLQRKTMKMDQFRPNITEIKISTFWMSGKIPDSANAASETPFPCFSDPLFAIFALAAKYSKKCRF